MYKGKKILAIVPARLSSKRLKQKNIIKVSRGKILINWTYEAIKNSKYIDCSILSTESEKIKNLATRIGFDVPFKRPKYLSNDHVDSEEVIKHVLKKIKFKCDYVLLLQPTSPLRNSKDIDKSIEHIIDKNFSSLISISASKKKKNLMLKQKKIS